MEGYLAKVIPLSIAALALSLGDTHSTRSAELPITMNVVRSQIVIASDGGAVQELHIEIGVGAGAAALQAAQQSLAFSEGVDTVELLDGYTQKSDGRHLPADLGSASIKLASTAPGDSPYNGNSVISVTMPDVSQGDVVGVTWRRTIHHPLIPGQFSLTSLYPRTLTWKSVELTLSSPKELPLFIEAHGPKVEESVADGVNVYHITYSASAMPNDITALLPLDRSPRLFASTFQSWQSFSRLYASVFEPHVVHSSKVDFEAEHAVFGATSRYDEARLITRWVGDHIRWSAVYLGNGSIIPQDSDEVLRRGYGDCKDQVALLIAMLRSRGIGADPVLVHLGNTFTLSGPPTYTAFNHMIAYIPEWNLYVDPTAGGSPFGQIPMVEHGKPFLRISAAGELPGRMPLALPGDSNAELRTTAELTEDGVIRGVSTTDASGSYAVALRLDARVIRAQGGEKIAEQQLRRLGQIGTGVYRSTDYVDILSSNERIEGQFRLDPHPAWLSGESFPIPTGLRVLPRPGDGPLGPMNLAGLPTSEPTPCFAAKQVEELSLTIPSGFQPERLPDDLAIAGKFFNYDSHWTFVAGAVSVRRTLSSTVDTPLCSGEVHAEAASGLARIKRDLELRISLVRQLPRL